MPQALAGILAAAQVAAAPPVDVYILTGQSNSLGTTASETNYTPGTHPADSRVRFWWANVSGTPSWPAELIDNSGNGFKILQMQQGAYGSPYFWGPEFGFARTLYIYDNQGLGFRPSSLGLPASIDANVDRLMFPRFGVSGMATLGGNDHRYNAFMSYTTAASLTKAKGGHTLKTGFEGRMLRVNVWEARSAGTFNFRANETQGPNPTAARPPA